MTAGAPTAKRVIALLAALTLPGCGDFIVREDARQECDARIEALRREPTGVDVPLTLFRCEAADGSWSGWADWDGLERLRGTPGGFQCTAAPWFDKDHHPALPQPESTP